MMRRLFSLVILLLLPASVLAQGSSQGSIFGTIYDPSESVVPGAAIAIVNEGTGATRRTTTDAHGSYRVEFLPPGQYRIEISKDAFQASTVPNITLLLGQALRVDRTLKLAATAAEVTVSGELVTLNTTNATHGFVIQNNEIENLPLNGREFLSLAGLAPGAYTGSRPLDVTVAAKAGNVVGYNGARGNQNSFYLDGGANTSPYSNNMVSSPSVDAIQEFRVETSQYSARYGQGGGGIISVVTKSGTNAFHGSLYEYHRNKALDALPYFFKGTRKQLPDHRWNQSGGSIGGPILANKLFFFSNAEFFPQRDAQQKIAFAPTAAERAGDVRNSINPWSGQPVILTNPYTGEVIPSGILPANLRSPVGERLMALWPEPNYPENPFFNYRVFRPVRNDTRKYIGRIDAVLTPQDTVAGTFNFGNADRGVPGFIEHGDKIASDHDRTLTGRHTRVYSSNLVGITGVAYSQQFYGDRFRLADKAYGVDLGMDPTYNSNPGMPWILLFTQGSQFFTFGAAGDNKNFTRQVQLYEDLSWQKGQHAVQFGGMYWRQRFKWQFFSGSAQYFVNLIDGVAPGTWPLFGVTGSSFTNLLAGLYNLGVFGAGGGEYARFERNTFAAYVQDTWRIHPRLTLSAGLRYDNERPFKTLDGKYLSLDDETGKIRYAEGAPGIQAMRIPYLTGGPALTYQPSNLIFEPRIGVAWQPFKRSTTVVRSGYGIFHTSEPASNMYASSFAHPFGGPAAVWMKGILGGWPDGDHLNTFDKQPYGVDFVRTHSPGCCFTYTAKDFPRSYLHQWNLTVGHQLPRGIAAEIAYVGSRGVELSGYIPLPAYNPEVYSRFVKNYGEAVKPPFHIKGFNSKYKALQLNVRKNTGGGLTFQGAYTWSHAQAEASNDNVTENLTTIRTAQGTSTWTKFYSNAGFDVRHRVSVSAIYELPFGRERRFGGNWNTVLDNLLGRWSVNAIYTAQTGFPFSVRGAGGTIPDRTCDGNLLRSQRTLQKWFDYTCFPTHLDERRQPANGNAGANQIYGPGINNWDIGIHKRFTVLKRKEFEFRAEAFNVFNHPQFLGPVSGNWFSNTKESAEIGNARPQRQIQLALKFIF